MTSLHRLTAVIAFLLLAAPLLPQSPAALTAKPAAPPTHWLTTEGTYTLDNFRFHDGSTLPHLRLHYLTLGHPHLGPTGHVDNAVLLLHGTGGDAHSLLNPVFSDILFVPGGVLDIAKYFLILPDDIGHGTSSKPSDGLHARFPQYDYDDMVRSQQAMLTEGLHVDHLRLILGTSMGCMQAFVWGEAYPTFAQALAPFACLPVELAGRNRMMRYMIVQAVQQDPAWLGGEYKTQPTDGLRTANDLLLVMGSSPLQMQKAAPTRASAEAYVDRYLAGAMAHMDANDLIFFVNASRNYNPEPNLEKITAPVLWINSADDYINPPELGIAERMVKRLPHARFLLIPTSDATRGHGTHTQAAVWRAELTAFMRQTETP